MNFHKVASIFPLMEGQEFDSLCQDIAANGLHEAIWTYGGEIIDGRNRYRACETVGIIPSYREYTGTDDKLLAFVISLNLKRRHLNESQRAVIAAKLANIQLGDNQYKSGYANLQTQPISQAQAAEMMNVSQRMVATVKAIESASPELIGQIESGELTANRAWTETRRKEVTAKLESIDNQKAKAIEGIYDVIVIDPPWPMVKIEREVRENQVEFEYPTMTIEEMASINIPAADDCHIFLWTTQKHLPEAVELLAIWGIKYVCEFVWHKPGGFQPYGLPQYNCEFVLYARKGTPQFIDFKDFKTCFDAQRGEHSEKPDIFYEMIRRVTAGRRLDMFSRRNIDGFDGWGNEVQ